MELSAYARRRGAEETWDYRSRSKSASDSSSIWRPKSFLFMYDYVLDLCLSWMEKCKTSGSEKALQTIAQ